MMTEATMTRTQPALLRARDVARELALTTDTVYEMAARGDLPAVYLGRNVRFPRREIERLIHINIDVEAGTEPLET